MRTMESLKTERTMNKSDVDWNFTEETLISIVSRLAERKTELEKELKKSDYNTGLLDGYNQALDMIKNDLESRGFNAKDFGMDA